MVIPSSDSTNTLVSLDQHDGLKRSVDASPYDNGLFAFSAENNAISAIEFRRTSILLPEDEDDFDSDSEEDDDSLNCYRDAASAQPARAASVLYLPVKGMSVDESLKCVSVLMDSRDNLLAQKPVLLDAPSCSKKTQQQRILYLAQGEIAHCTPSQTDVLVSDKATTCHILAMRSTSPAATTAGTVSSVEPLCTMTHLDGSSYSSCVRAAVQAHHYHHHSVADADADAEIKLDIHIVGGFEDDHGASRDISTWLLFLLADLADSYADSILFTLRTVCVTAMNSDGCSSVRGSGTGSPLARGLALDCHTGQVTTAKCGHTVAGPASALRSARLWMRCNSSSSSSSSSKELHLIHTPHCDSIILQPFYYETIGQGWEALLELSDDALLQYCSTSPDCEDDDFCHDLRSTLHFMLATPCTTVFGARCDEPLSFRRSSCHSSSVHQSNTWVAAPAIAAHTARF